MANSKIIELPATFEKKVFLNKETGETFDYYAVSVSINKQYVKLSIPKESKQLLNYLLDNFQG